MLERVTHDSNCGFDLRGSTHSFFVSVAPDAIYNHVKTFKEEPKHLHYAAPEYKGDGRSSTLTSLIIFSPFSFFKIKYMKRIISLYYVSLYLHFLKL